EVKKKTTQFARKTLITQTRTKKTCNQVAKRDRHLQTKKKGPEENPAQPTNADLPTLKIKAVDGTEKEHAPHPRTWVVVYIWATSFA
ncbi:hypothetical protein AAGG49_21930, partial [Stenotrophomonas maltophilia]